MKKASKVKTKPYNTLVVDTETVLAWGLPYDSDEAEGVKVLSDTITDTGRWSVHNRLIVEIKGKVYETSYSIGSTEYQDESPWQGDSTVEFIEVHEVEKTIKVWERILVEVPDKKGEQ